MKTYEIQISIDFTKTVIVEADSIEDAEAQAEREVYDNAITEITIDHSEEIGG